MTKTNEKNQTTIIIDGKVVASGKTLTFSKGEWSGEDLVIHDKELLEQSVSLGDEVRESLLKKAKVKND